VKIVVGRGPGEYGGIFRRFRALAEYCAGRHDMIGVLIMGSDDVRRDDPVTTYSFALAHATLDLMRATTAEEAIVACDGLIQRIAERLDLERPDRVLASDTDLKGLCVVEACRLAGLPVTTHVASVAHMDAAFESRLATRYMPAVEDYCLEQSTRLIFPSLHAARFCATRTPRMAPWTVIYNGIAAEFLDAPAPRPDPRRIGAVMRLSRIKNPDTLGRIAAALRSAGFTLEVVTDAKGVRNFRPLVEHARLIPPTLNSAALAAFYGGCRAIVSPSHFEASGNVPMEALASGTPAIVTRQMGVAELLRSLGREDLIVDVDDVEGTVRRVIDAAPVDPSLRERLRAELAWPTVCERLVGAL
jgi:glycosyltransferase involved in cell wall biosynthesis